MPLNYPGPYQLELTSTVSGLTHKTNFNCDPQTDPDPGDDISTVQLVERGGGLVTISNAINNWVTLIKPFYNTGYQFNDVTLWRCVPNSFDRVFIGAMVVDVAGSSATPTQLASQVIFTFRTVEGGNMKLNLIESVNTPGSSVSRAAAAGNFDAIFDFVESVDNWILARDTSYPIVGIAYHPGQNEALFKKRYRTL